MLKTSDRFYQQNRDRSDFYPSFFLNLSGEIPRKELIPDAKAGSKANLTPVQIISFQYGMI
jgi:hypothetical protein